MDTKKRPVGHPPFYEKVEDLQKVIDEFFKGVQGEWDEDPASPTYGRCINPPKGHPTITGLALYLGFNSRQALLNYEHKEEFNDAVKKAKLRIEMNYEQALFNKNAAGPIFALKNFGWSDKKEIEVRGTTINFTDAG